MNTVTQATQATQTEAPVTFSEAIGAVANAVETAMNVAAVKEIARQEAVEAVPVRKVRPTLQERINARKRTTFGQAFIQGVLGEYHRDVAKMVVLGRELGMGTVDELKAKKLEDLRHELAEIILTLPEGAMPQRATIA